MERCITVLRLFGITITKPLCGTNGRRRDESGTGRHSYRLSLFIQFTVDLTQLASDVIRKEILFIILSFSLLRHCIVWIVLQATSVGNLYKRHQISLYRRLYPQRMEILDVAVAVAIVVVLDEEQ